MNLEMATNIILHNYFQKIIFDLLNKKNLPNMYAIK